MPKNPLTDTWQFLTATTDDYMALGNWRFLVLALFWALIAASVIVAVKNWSEDPRQRSGYHVGIWTIRVLIGCMWFEAMLWKLPLPASEGLSYWTGQISSRAAFEWHRDLATNVLLPYLYLFGPVVFLAELTFAVSMILGFAVRAVATAAIFFVLQLWLGIYLPGTPAEWPWSYIFLAMLMFLFALLPAGRSLGVDAWLRNRFAAIRDHRGAVGTLFSIVT